ncbi:MAG TPA: YkgJ family cysteine cluster protein [Methanoregula sp.]|nr:YkgJ family cysteine cluster protein [Methanoregula sp.]
MTPPSILSVTERAGSAEIPLPYRIVALMEERNRLFAYPLERIAADIRATRFRCSRCGECCTRRVNSHIFLIDHDVDRARAIDPASVEPAPDPEFCDQDGVLYVSGSALRMRDDAAGSCWFLDDGKCRIYGDRFLICRMYPHMLRWYRDETGTATWLHFSRRNRHGRYDARQSREDCIAIARGVREYENAFLTQQIAFLETVHEHFAVHGLWHDPAILRDRVQRLRRGLPVRIKVFHAGELEDFPVPGLSPGTLP